MWVAISLASLILVIILVLCVPVDFVFRVDTRSRPRVKLRFVWFFGLVGKEIGKKKEKPPEKEERVKPVKRSKSRMNRQLILDITRTEGLFKQIKQFIKDLFSCLNLKEFIVDLIVHPDNPADTGILYALALPFNNLSDSRSSYRINIWPSFESDTIFKGNIVGSARIQPVKLFKPFARLVFSMPAVRLVYTFVSNKWKKEK